MLVSRRQLVGILDQLPDNETKSELFRFLVRNEGVNFEVTLAYDDADQTWGWGIECEVVGWWYIDNLREIPALDQLGRDMGELEAAFDSFKAAKRAEVKVARKLLLGATVPTKSAPALPKRLTWDLNVSEVSPVVRGTWVKVADIVEMTQRGMTSDDIIRLHPELTTDDIRVAFGYYLRSREPVV